jgi:hypothetical protein
MFPLLADNADAMETLEGRKRRRGRERERERL